MKYTLQQLLDKIEVIDEETGGNYELRCAKEAFGDSCLRLYKNGWVIDGKVDKPTLRFKIK